MMEKNAGILSKTVKYAQSELLLDLNCKQYWLQILSQEKMNET